MASREIHSIISPVIVFNIDLLDVNTTHFGNIAVDTSGFESVEFLFFSHHFSVPDGDYELIVRDGDTNVPAAHANVPTLELVGDVPKILESEGNDLLKRVGYVGKKRFVSAHIVSTNIAGAGQAVGAFVVLNTPRHAATENP